MHRKYTAEDFDEDLRTVLRRSGCRGEKIVFILDESNMLDSSFLERMNTLLANGEVGDIVSYIVSLVSLGKLIILLHSQYSLEFISYYVII